MGSIQKYTIISEVVIQQGFSQEEYFRVLTKNLVIKIHGIFTVTLVDQFALCARFEVTDARHLCPKRGEVGRDRMYLDHICP